jgi:hypothetical protein
MGVGERLAEVRDVIGDLGRMKLTDTWSNPIFELISKALLAASFTAINANSTLVEGKTQSTH